MNAGVDHRHNLSIGLGLDYYFNKYIPTSRLDREWTLSVTTYLLYTQHPSIASKDSRPLYFRQ